MNITIVQEYAPTTDHEDQEVEEFYEELENTIRKIPNKDILIIQGDFNAKIGPDANENWAGTVGQYGTGITNGRGLHLLEFVSSQWLTIANTLYPHKQSRRTTWHAPNGKTHNQIDFKSSINRARTRTYPGADIGSDHDLVLLTMEVKLKTKYQGAQPRIKFDLEKLMDPEIDEIFQAQLGGRFAALNLLDTDTNDLINSFNEAVHKTAEEVLGRQRKKHQPWISNDILDLCDKRRTLKKSKNTSPESAAAYHETNNQVRKQMREAKERWIDQQFENIDKGMEKGNSKQAYDTLKKITSEQVHSHRG